MNTLDQLRTRGWNLLYPEVSRITVGMSTCGRAAGAGEVYQVLDRAFTEQDIQAQLVPVGHIILS